jgi:hypothetical protein
VPLLVGLLTKLNASPKVKSVLNLGLVALGAALATSNQIGFTWKPFLVNFGVAWAVSVGTYYGFYKPTGVAPAVANIAPGVGVG